MQNLEINENFFQIFFTDSCESFCKSLASWLNSINSGEFTIWNITGTVCQPSEVVPSKISAAFDIYELGYPGGITAVNRNVSFFDESFFISYALFFGGIDHPMCAVTFHSEKGLNAAKELEKYSQYISKRIRELSLADRSMDLYVDYQKKVDFIKKAGVIFKALEVESVISSSLAFFMDVFSADAVCAIRNNKFYGIGLEESDLDDNIFINDCPMAEYLKDISTTEFTENLGYSSKFNIKNIFFVYEELCGLRFALFNVMPDVVPDKEFSALVAQVVSIAVENALNHEEMTRFKVEETEMSHTVDILSRFVAGKISPKISGCDIFAMNIPAKKAGGDFADIKTDGDNIKFCIADVCGKGYSAAILTVVLSVFFSGGAIDHIKNFVQQLNSFLLAKNFDDKFITAFFGEFNIKERQLKYIYCGHEPAVLIDGNSITNLKSENLPLGIMDEDYQVKTVYIPQGATFFAYTDGLLEYTDLDSLVNLLKNNDSTAKNAAENLYNTLVTNPENQKDDFTCIIMKL